MCGGGQLCGRGLQVVWVGCGGGGGILHNDNDDNNADLNL